MHIDHRSRRRLALPIGLVLVMSVATCSSSPDGPDPTGGGLSKGGGGGGESIGSGGVGTSAPSGGMGAGGESGGVPGGGAGNSAVAGGRPGAGRGGRGGVAGGGPVAGSGASGAAGMTATGLGGSAGTRVIPAGGAGGNASSSSATTISTHCTSALPAGAQAVDVSQPSATIGTGTSASCTFAALNTAISKGGIITFDCGSAPVTIPVTSTMILSTSADTVIDGGNTITLDGQSQVQIFNYNHPDFMKSDTRVTLQHLTLVNGKTTPTQLIPTAPAPCSQGYDDGEGGALYMQDGNLTVIDCTFSNNQAALLGPDTGGGAIYITGSKNGAIIVGSIFTGNSASNAGAVGALFATLDIYNSVFTNNKATGNGANSDDPTQCSAINNDQNECGSGGNGGAIYQDGGDATSVLLCGVDVEDNVAGANAFGGGVFMTSDDYSGTITVQDSTITGNTGGSWTQVNSGPDLGTAFGVNAKASTITNATLQGVN